jgi:hypothetical protein
MFGAKPNKPQTRIDSLIGSGTRIEGNVIFTGGLRVDGEVRGDVRGRRPADALVVSEQRGSRARSRVASGRGHHRRPGPCHGLRRAAARSRVTGDVH